MARYSSIYKRMEVIFRDGTPWHWDNVDPFAWRVFRSPNTPSTYDFLRGPQAPLPEEYGKGAHGGWGHVIDE